MNERIKNVKNIDIVDYLKTLLSHWLLLLIAAIIFGSIFFVKTEYFTEPIYVSDGTLYVSNNESDVYVKQDVDINDIYAARILVYTYVEMIQTRSFLEDVSNELPFECSWQQIRGMLNVEMVNDTELLKVTITSNDPKVSYEIAKKYFEVVPGKLSQMFANGGVWVIDPALYPTFPNDNGVARTTIFGVIIGIIVGAIFVLLKEIFNNKFRNSGEIEYRYKIPVLGEFYLNNAPGERKGKFEKNKTNENKNNAILSDDTDFTTSETYKSIRTNIMFSTPKSDKGRIIVVTSASPGDGKTTTTTNLAITFAQTGAKVIVIDCDLRKSQVHKNFDLDKSLGVSNVVCGYASLDDAIKKDIRPNLDCLTSGETPPNPAELLNSTAFEGMLEQLISRYDYIFIDTPPIAVVTDAAVIMKRDVDVILVAKQSSTTYGIFDKTVDEIKLTGAKIIGTIVHLKSDVYKKFGKYNYKYNYKYGYAYKEEKEG